LPQRRIALWKRLAEHGPRVDHVVPLFQLCRDTLRERLLREIHDLIAKKPGVCFCRQARSAGIDSLEHRFRMGPRTDLPGRSRRMLSKHAQTRFIWCHAGMSRRLVIPTLVTDLRKLLQRHTNLWIDLSFVVYEEAVLEAGRPRVEWIRLIGDFPNRFILGSDVAGRFSGYEGEIRKYDVLLDALDPSVARRVAKENFLSVLSRRVRTRIAPRTQARSASGILRPNHRP
jgi:hypothetical protein